jgi:hypothetical protein
MEVAFMKRKWPRFVFTVFLISAFLIAFADMAAGMIAMQQPTAAVRGNQAIAMAKKDAVTTKVKVMTTMATDAVNEAVVQTTASETTDSAVVSASQETPADVEQTCVNHTFGSWQTVTAPTLNDCGLRKRTCAACGHEETEGIPPLTAENNSVSIPSANMVISFALTELNQMNVDACGAVCDLNFFKTYFGTDDIMVSGHRSNAIGKLYRTAVGDEITLNLNGNLTTYTVIISEEATITADGKDYIGVNTGTRFVTTSYDRQSLRMYTCYGDGRWIVTALENE